MLLHGWGASVSAFLFVAENLSEKYRVTALDFAGFGQSEEPSKPYGVPDYADDVLKLVEKLGIFKAVFVGHSFGGRVCLEIAARRPDIVSKLVLADSAGLKPKRGIKYHFRVTAHKILRKLGFKGLGGSSDYRNLPPTMRETFKSVVNYDQTYLLKDINCPTAIFWGDRDEETPLYMARKFEKEIADSKLFMLDGGHFSYADDPRKFLLILRAFIG